MINLEVDGGIDRNQSRVADNFARYFSSMANGIGNPEILAQAEDELRDHESVRRILREDGIPTNTPQFNFHSFIAEEVSKAIGNLDLHKSIGHDKIPLWALKMASEELSHPLQLNYTSA